MILLRKTIVDGRVVNGVLIEITTEYQIVLSQVI